MSDWETSLFINLVRSSSSEVFSIDSAPILRIEWSCCEDMMILFDNIWYKEFIWHQVLPSFFVAIDSADVQYKCIRKAFTLAVCIAGLLANPQHNLTMHQAGWDVYAQWLAKQLWDDLSYLWIIQQCNWIIVKDHAEIPHLSDLSSWPRHRFLVRRKRFFPIPSNLNQASRHTLWPPKVHGNL